MSAQNPKKPFVLRMDEKVLQGIAAWAEEDFRSVNGQMEFILSNALKNAGRAPAPKKETK